MYQRKFYSVGPATGDSGVPAPINGSDDTPIPNVSPAMTLSRDNWSQLVGASTETVIRVLSDLRAEGLIGLNASQITLLDIAKLTRLKH